MVQIGDLLGVTPHQVVLPAADGRNRAWLYRSGAVLSETVLDDGSVQLTVQADQQLLGQIKQKPGSLDSSHQTSRRIEVCLPL